MNASYTHCHAESDVAKRVWLTLDVRDSAVNQLSFEVLQELKALLADIAKASPKALIIESGKESGFIAGADVHEFTQLADPAQALDLIRQGQDIMAQIEALPCPTIAVINGHCLGGGLELALACDYRLAIDTPATRLGLPEVKLGIHPGFGGSVRSIARCGVLKAMDLMLTGRSLSAKQARRIGLVNEVLPERQIENAVTWYVDQQPKPRPPGLLDTVLHLSPVRKLAAGYLRKQVEKKTHRQHYPAPFALIDLWEKQGNDPAKMYPAEAESVAQLITGKTSKNLVRVFELQNLLKSLGKKSTFSPRHVHVIGAGTMGGDIAAWCALQGLDVTIEDSNSAALAATKQRAEKIYRRRFRDYPTLHTAAHDRLLPDPKGEGRKHADVIIEAIFEDLSAKQNLFSALETVAKKDAILASNTSSIRLEDIASALSQPERLVGLHFFNPVAKMPLVEVIHQKSTTATAREQAQSFCRHIDKLPLPVFSSPGFLVNRILMPYLLEAARLNDQGMSIADIDLAARDYGMPMGPLELADTVGLDICLHVATILAEPMQLTIPDSLKQLVAKNQLGKKTGQGYYSYHRRKIVRTKPSDTINREAQQQLMGKITNEALRALNEGIVESADQLDAGVIFGTGFAPFLGGPLHAQDEEMKTPG